VEIASDDLIEEVDMYDYKGSVSDDQKEAYREEYEEYRCGAPCAHQ